MASAVSSPGSANVVAVFGTQGEVDDAILALRLAGFGDDRIGAFAGRDNLVDRNHGFSGAVIGGVVGIALGYVAANFANRWSEVARDVSDLFGLTTTLVVCGALFVGLVGWGIGVGMKRAGVSRPAVDPTAAPFTLAVAAGDGAARDRAWEIIHQTGGQPVPAAS